MTRIYSQERDARAAQKGPPGDLLTRLGPELVELGLAKRITWTEAEYVVDAIAYFDAREASRWRRQQELIARGGL